MKIIEYSPEYRDAAREVFLATASEKARTDARHGKFTLLMYCEEYLDHETCYLLMNDDNEVCGYILCAKDAVQWAEHMKPYAEKIRELGAPYDRRVDEQTAEYLSQEEEYPAHMHIDILEEYTGGGNGSALMKVLLERLKKDHVRGIALGVAKRNERAAAFYRKMGFSILAEDEGGYAMGLKTEEL